MVSEEQAKQDVDSQQNESTPSPGAMLKARREELGLSQQEIADKLFLKVRQINEIESDKLDGQASVTFTKGYVRNYAKQVNLNSQEVIEAFERFHNQTSVPSSEKLQSFSRRVAKQTHDDRWMMVTYVILLLIVAGVVAWWYQQPGDDVVSDVALPSKVKAEAASTPLSQESTGMNAALEDNTPSTDQPELINTTGDVSADSLPVENENNSPGQSSALEQSGFTQEGELDDGAISAPDTTVDDTNNLTALVASATDTPDVTLTSDAAPISMIFTFDDDCWINITDATGEAIAYGVKQKGRIMEIQGVPPVEVTLGAPDNVRISVDGDAVDISSYQNGRTARFTLPM